MFLLPSLPGMETPEQRRRKRIIWLILLVVLASIYPAYRAIVHWRSDQLVSQAEQFMQGHAEGMAYAKAQSALGLTPHSIRAQRIVATVLSEQRDPNGVRFWAEILGRPESILTDFESGVDSAVGQRALGMADDFLKKGLARFPNESSLIRRAASLYEMAGDSVRSIQFAERFLKEHPTDDVIRLVLERQVLALGTPANRVLAKNEIMAIAARSEDLRVAALKLISKLDGLSRDDAQKAVDLMKTVKDPGAEALMVRADLELKLDPSRLPELAQEIATQGKAKARDAGQVAELGRWLNNKQQYDRTTDVIVPSDAMANRDLFLIRVDAMAARKQWKEIDELLSSDKVPIEPVLVSLFKIRARRELGDTASTFNLWNELQRNLLKQPEATSYVGQYLEVLGETEHMTHLYQEVVKYSPHTMAAWAGLIHLREQAGDIPGLIAILKEAEAKNPGNDVFANDYNYLTLLTDPSQTDSARAAESMAKAHPDDIAYRITYALSKMVTGDNTNAMAILSAVTIDWSQLTPGQKSVVASVTARVGRRDDAMKLANAIDLSRLKKPEMEMLNRALAGK